MAKAAGNTKPVAPLAIVADKLAPIIALGLAWLVPGAGHIYLGRVRRGAIIFVTIAATFWAGIGIGGVMTVDPRNERWWFVAEMLSGIHGVVGWQLEERAFKDLKISEPPPPQQASARVLWNATADKAMKEAGISLTAPMDNVARAYSGVAGLLNLMCIFDAVMLALLGVTGERREDEGAAGESKA